jgi:hypothetical protein
MAMAVMPVAGASASTMVNQLWFGPGAGTWTDAARWDAYYGTGTESPEIEAMYPSNNADYTFAVTIGSSTGAVTLDGQDVTIDYLRQYGSSMITGSGNITVLGDFDWVGGTLDGAGSLTVNGNLTVDGGSQLTRFVSRRINAYGTTTVTGSLYLTGPNSAFHNYGAFVLDKNTDVGAPNGGIPTFYNHGTFTKKGTGTSYVRSNLDNSGTLTVSTGTLTFLQGLTNSGTLDVASGAKLSFNNSGTGTYAADSHITGQGAVEFLSGTHNLGLYEATGPLTFGGNTNVTFNNTIHPSSIGDLYGTVTFNAPQSFPDLKLTGAAVGGTGDLEVTNKLTWTSGEMRGTGTTTIPAGAALDLVSTNAALILNRPVVNDGTATLNGRTFAIGSGGGSFTNNGTFTAVLGDVSYSGTQNVGRFGNVGTYRKAGTGTQKIEGILFDNAGTVYVDQGTLDLNARFANSGSLQLAAGTTLKLSGSTFTGNIGSSLTGPGTVQVTGGTHTFAGGGAFAPAGPLSVTGGSLTLNGPFATTADVTVNAPSANLTFNGATSLDNLTLQSGAINGTGAVTVNGTMAWVSGYFNAGGSLVFAEGSSLTLGGQTGGNYYVARPVETRGAVAWTNGSLTFTGAATWDNYGDMAIGGVTTIGRSGSGSSQFRNYGTITKTGTTTLSTDTLVNFQNYGTINLNGGGLTLRDNAVNGGTINVGAGATLMLGVNGFTNQPGSMITGDGTVSFSGNTLIDLPAGTFDPTGTVMFPYSANVAINNAIHPATLGTIDGTVAFNADQTFTSLAISNSGVLGGTGAITVTDSFSWGGGATQINAAVTLGKGVTWDMATSGNRTLNGSLTINKAAYLSAGSLFLNAGSVLTNNGTVEISATGFSKGGNGSARIDNNSLITKVSSAGITLAQGITLNNAGVLDVQGGTLGMYDVPVQQTGTTLTGGTWIVRDAATLNLGGGSNITTNGATIALHGPTSRFDKINALATNNGSLSLLDGRSFATAGAFANGGTLVVKGGGTFTAIGALTGAGNVTVGQGSALAVKNGWTQTGGVLTVDGAVTHSGGTSAVAYDVSQRWGDGSTLNVTGGTLTLASDAGGYYPNFTLAATVAGTAATLQSSTTQRLKSLSVGTGGTVTLLSGTVATLFTHSLDLTGTGKLDLNDNRLIVDDDIAGGSPELTALRQYLLAGNLVSTTAAADGQHRFAIGYADASILGVTTWGGLYTYPAMAVARVTWLGDANLDGTVDADDYALIDRGLARSVASAHWTDGDFNYDGVVDQNDYLLIDRVFVQSHGGSASPALLADREARFGAAYVTQLLTAVPEPGTLGLVAAAMAMATGGRRRRR